MFSEKDITNCYNRDTYYTLILIICNLFVMDFSEERRISQFFKIFGGNREKPQNKKPQILQSGTSDDEKNRGRVKLLIIIEQAMKMPDEGTSRLTIKFTYLEGLASEGYLLRKSEKSIDFNWGNREQHCREKLHFARALKQVRGWSGLKLAAMNLKPALRGAPPF